MASLRRASAPRGQGGRAAAGRPRRACRLRRILRAAPRLAGGRIGAGRARRQSGLDGRGRRASHLLGRRARGWRGRSARRPRRAGHRRWCRPEQGRRHARGRARAQVRPPPQAAPERGGAGCVAHAAGHAGRPRVPRRAQQPCGLGGGPRACGVCRVYRAAAAAHDWSLRARRRRLAGRSAGWRPIAGRRRLRNSHRHHSGRRRRRRRPQAAGRGRRLRPARSALVTRGSGEGRGHGGASPFDRDGPTAGRRRHAGPPGRSRVGVHILPPSRGGRRRRPRRQLRARRRRLGLPHVSAPGQLRSVRAHGPAVLGVRQAARLRGLRSARRAGPLLRAGAAHSQVVLSRRRGLLSRVWRRVRERLGAGRGAGRRRNHPPQRRQASRAQHCHIRVARPCANGAPVRRAAPVTGRARRQRARARGPGRGPARHARRNRFRAGRPRRHHAGLPCRRAQTGVPGSGRP